MIRSSRDIVHELRERGDYATANHVERAESEARESLTKPLYARFSINPYT